ncbi:MAG: hypothetical protein CMD98_06825 [Gammaproteobacteria bacterium]|nr:hypothetical protein [Gammaproteobacteria bacterium]|tara:strand:+ start:36462 stop:37685 length:1224 start_codon:yes stop_codon:yes gene_type:complete
MALDFKNYIFEAKNTHMTHVEDMVIDGGVAGTRAAINALRDLRNMLAGSTNDTKQVTVKWDGAPAVFAGIDPNDDEFFVAKKGIFNKNPKVYKSHSEIDADTSGDLSDKLKVAYTELKKVVKSGVYQGDIMFIKKDLKTEKIDGLKYITFHPNTIVYAVPTDQAKDIKKSKIGVVWHTKYTGSTFDTMSASFSVKDSDFKATKSVWQKTANLPDISGLATLNKKETDEITKHISMAGKLFQKIKASTLKDVSTNTDINLFINTFRNAKVREQSEITNTTKHTQDLINWIHKRYDKEIKKLKSDKGKARKNAAKIAALDWFNASNKKNLKLMFDMQNELVSAKSKLLTHLDTMDSINTFVKTKNGFKVTGAEGYVAIDHLTNGAVKIVDRMEFSHNNFSKNIIKGWDK